MIKSSRGQALAELIFVIPLFICVGVAFLPLASQNSRQAFENFASLGSATSAATFSLEERTYGNWNNTLSLSISSVMEDQLNPSRTRNGATQKEDSRFGDALKAEPSELGNNCPITEQHAQFSASQSENQLIMRTCSPRLGYEKKLRMSNDTSTQPNLFKTSAVFLPPPSFSWEQRSKLAVNASAAINSNNSLTKALMNPKYKRLYEVRTRLRKLALLQQAAWCLAEHCSRSPSQVCTITGAAGVFVTTLQQGNGADSLCPSTKKAIEQFHRGFIETLKSRTAEAKAIEDGLESQIATIDNVSPVE